MKTITRRWLGLLLAVLMVFSLTVPAGALQIPDPDDQMYAIAHTEGDIVPVNVDPFTNGFHQERLDPTNVYGAFDAVQMPTGTPALNANDYFFGLASRAWTAYTFREPFCNVDTVPDIEFSEVTWGNWHAEGARVYLLDAQVINGDGDIVTYSGDDFNGDAFGNSYYAGIMANKVAIGGVASGVKEIIRNYYLPAGVTRTFYSNTYATVGNFGITQFYLPDEVVSARAILLVDITSDSVPIDKAETPTMKPFNELVAVNAGSYDDVAGTGALLTFQSRAQGTTEAITDDIITATISTGSNGNTDGYDLDAIQVYDYNPPLDNICGYKLDSDTGAPLAGVTISLERLNSDLEWDFVSSITTEADGRYCFPNLEPGVYRVSEELAAGWERLFPDGDGTHIVTLPSTDDNLIANGDFELGNTLFTSEYEYIVNTGTQALWGEGDYAVGTDPYLYHYLWQSFADHTPGEGNDLMMIVNGEEFAADKIVWTSTADVNPGTTYNFSFWGATSYPEAYSSLEVYINGDHIDTYHAPELLATWAKYSVDWNSGAAETAEIRLVCNTLIHTGNDFALDDFCLVEHSLDFVNHEIHTDTVDAFKFYDADADGDWDADEDPIEGWKIELYDAQNTLIGTAYTDPDGMVSFTQPYGTYTVREGTPTETCWRATTPDSAAITLDGSGERVDFGNLCLGAGGGKTLGFWSNKNGKALIKTDDLTQLIGLNLVNTDGSDFDPTSYAQLRTWLLSADATNMARMLSTQLAAMELNVHNGNVNGDALIYAPGIVIGDDFITISELMELANDSLATEVNTTEAGEIRAYQELLKNALDAANNNLNFVMAGPCPFTF